MGALLVITVALWFLAVAGYIADRLTGGPARREAESRNQARPWR